MFEITNDMFNDREQPKPLQATKLSDIEQMTDDLMAILKMAWGKNWGQFFEAYPVGTKPNDITFPAITYSFDKMEPGEIGSNGRRDVKPKIRGQYKEADGSVGTTIKARIIDAYVTFYCWEENPRKASKLARDFMVVMDSFTGYLKERGIQEIRFIEMVPGERAWNTDDAVNKEIRYRIRYEEQIVSQMDLIKDIITNIVIENENEVISVSASAKSADTDI